MSSLIPPFKPRPPMPYTPPTASCRKALRRFQIFPNYHRMPTSNALCAQFQIRRKELDFRILQLNQLKALKETLNTISTTLSDTTAEHLRIFTQLARVHHITTSFSPLSEDGQMESPISISFKKQLLTSPSSASQNNVHVHPHHIEQDDTFLELMSRASSPLSYSATSYTTEDSHKIPEPLSFQSPPFQSATLHCAPLRGPGYFIAEAYYTLHRSFKNRR